MFFSSWLFEQLEEPGELGYIANVCWKDVNNGCANARFNASKWIAHLNKRHPAQKEVLIELIIVAFRQYMLTKEAE